MPKTGPHRFAVAVSGLALAFTTMTACASAAPYNPAHLAAPVRDRIARLCGSVIGLQRGEEHFDACVDSLSATAVGLVEGASLAQARDDCRQAGAGVGTAALAECELRAAPAAVLPDAAEPQPVSAPARSYFLTSNGEIFQRERLACARLGVEPAGSGFGQCVGDLQAALSAADNPAH